MITRHCPLLPGRQLPTSGFLFLLLLFCATATLHAQLTADFTVDVDSGAAPLSVQFFDQSTPQDSIIQRAWDLDGDGSTDSQEKNPRWTYEVPGRYSITLVVTDSSGSDTARYVDFVEVAPVDEDDIACKILVVEKSAPLVAAVELWGYAGSGLPGPVSPVSLRMPLDSNGCACFYKGKFLSVLSQNITDLLLLDDQDRVLGKAGFSYPIKDFIAGRRKDAIVILHRDLIAYQNHPVEQTSIAQWLYPRYLRFPYLAGMPLAALAAAGDAVTDPLYQTTVLIPPLSPDSGSVGRNQFRLDNVRDDRIPFVLLHGLGQTDGAWGADNDIVLGADTADVDFNGKRDYAFSSYPARLQRFDRNHADRYDVWQYYYPPDQNWEESGFLFARDLELLITLYDTTTSVVAAQGMGGLVLRAYLENTAHNYTYFATETGTSSYRGDIHKAVFLGTPHAGRLRAGLAYATPSTLPAPTVMDRYAPALRALMPGSAALQRLDPMALPLGIDVLNIAATAPAVAPPLPPESSAHDDGSTAISSATLPAPRTANAILSGYASEALQSPDDATGRLSARSPSLIPELLYAFAVSDTTLSPYIPEFLVYNAPDTLRFARDVYTPPFALPVHVDVGLPTVQLQVLGGGKWPVDGRLRLRLDGVNGNRFFVEALTALSQFEDPGLFLYPSTFMFSDDAVARQAGMGQTTFFPLSRSGALHPFRTGMLTLDGLGWQITPQQQTVMPDPIFARVDDLGRRFDLVRGGGDLRLAWSRERRNPLQITTHESMLLDTHHPLRALLPSTTTSLLEVTTDCLTQALTVIVDYSSASGIPDVSLLAPDASVITFAMADNATIFATHNTSLRMKALTVATPPTGNWLLLIDGVAVLPQGIRTAMASDDARDLRISIVPEHPLSLETAVATLALDAGPALTQPTATLVLIDSADTRTPLALRDDGTAPDTLAGDGIFSGFFQLPRAGSYRLEAFYTAQSASCSIRRTASMPLPVMPSLELLRPRGGESWQSGVAQSVRWQGETPQQVYIDFSTDSGNSWNEIAGPLTASDAAWSWTVPVVTSKTCRLRVRDAANAALSDMTPADFTVYEVPVISILAPDGGEQWRVDTEQFIRWDAIAVGALDLSYSIDGGSTWLPISSNVPTAAGQYAWRIPLTPSDRCRVRATSHGDPSISDESDAVFSITPIPAVELSVPNGGEQWQILTVQRVRWQSAAVDSVILAFSDDDGVHWEELARLAAGDGEYFWTVPDRISDLCRMRITAIDDPILADESDNVFSITPEPFLDLVSPVGGERWEIGTTEYIRWASAGITAVDIEYSTDNGQFWITAAVNIDARPQRYSWDIPREPSEFCRIRIRDTHDTTRLDVSTQVFAISESQTRPTLFAPIHQSEGESTRPTFRWIPFAGAVSYQLQVTSDPSMSFWTIDESGVGTSSFASPELDRNTKYFWRVKARRTDNSESEWSVLWNFTTSGSTIAAPAHKLPLDGAIGLATTINLFWHPAENADAYHLQVARDAGFNDILLDETGLTGLTFVVGGLSHEDDYWWRLRSGNTGTTAFSDWSRPWKFSTSPEPPRQLTPFDGLPDVPIRPLLQWYPVASARVYRMQVATDDRFVNIVFDSSNIASTALQLPMLGSYKRYWWRLNVTTGRGTSDWNDPWMFRTIDIGTSVTDPIALPAQLVVLGLWPHPASTSVTIAYQVPRTTEVHAALYDMLGRSVRSYPSLNVDAGVSFRSFPVDGIRPGSYILRLRSGTGTVERLLVIR